MDRTTSSKLSITSVETIDEENVLAYLSDDTCRLLTLAMLQQLPPYECPDADEVMAQSKKVRDESSEHAS